MNKLLEEVLNKPYPLSKQQKQAVVSDSRYLQIVAGACSGKTETMTRKILYYLIVKNRDLESDLKSGFGLLFYHRFLQMGPVRFELTTSGYLTFDQTLFKSLAIRPAL